MKINFLIVISFLMLFSVLSVIAQQSAGAPGTEKPLFHQVNANTSNACFVYKNYIVMTVSNEDGIGEDIKFYKRSGTSANFKKACAANTNRQPYMTFPNEDANYFFGLIGDKFLVDSGTGAGARGLALVSLTSKKILYSTEYNETVTVTGNTVMYHKPSNTNGSLKNCREAQKWKKQGGGVGWVRPVRLDLMTMKETPAGQLMCIYLE
jgi:hypothetical protein